MRLEQMRYKTFLWPHNPRVYTIDFQRSMAVHKVPFGRYYLQDLGMTRRVMRGEGEFVGADAYDQFRALACLFYENSPGLLIHPVWQAANAYFVGLTLRQRPQADYVCYTFEFWECYDLYDPAGRALPHAAQGGQAERAPQAASREGGQWHVVAGGENLWMLARRYQLELAQLTALNPQIKNPNLIHPGQKVRVA